MPEGAHPLPGIDDDSAVTGDLGPDFRRKLAGWLSLPFVDLDGTSWPLPFAAQILGVKEPDLRKRVKEEGLQPSGVIRMRDYRSQGRQPRAYPACELIRIAESMEFPDSPDSV